LLRQALQFFFLILFLSFVSHVLRRIAESVLSWNIVAALRRITASQPWRFSRDQRCLRIPCKLRVKAGAKLSTTRIGGYDFSGNSKPTHSREHILTMLPASPWSLFHTRATSPARGEIASGTPGCRSRVVLGRSQAEGIHKWATKQNLAR
jgi:hypothetical protein